MDKPLLGGRVLYPRFVHSAGHGVRGEGWGALGSSSESCHRGGMGIGFRESELPQGLGLVEII